MREEYVRPLAEAYYKFLQNIDWTDPILVAGLKEGRTKFLSNALIAATSGSKYRQGDYYSKGAIERLKSNNRGGLRYEHMVPKRQYIQKPCEVAAQCGSLVVEQIEALLRDYWRIAIVTIDDDRQLSPRSMPSEVDPRDVQARYTSAKIYLIERDRAFLELGWKL